MITKEPRKSYGFGIIRMSWQLTQHLAPFISLKEVNVQGELTQRHIEEQGIFEQMKQTLFLPDDYGIHGIFFEVPRMTWCVLVEAPGVPAPNEGEELPVLTHVYEHIYDFEKNTYQGRLKRIDVASDPHMALRVD